MQEFIQQAAEKFGLPTAKMESATGSLLGVVKKHADGSAFESLAGKVPGLAELAGKGGSSEKSGGGLMGMVSGALGKMGGGLGGAASVVATLKGSGLGGDQVDDFAGMFVGFLKKKVGGELLGSVLSKVPMLKNLVD